METRANYVAVGLFTLLVMLGAFGFIYWASKVSVNTNLVPVDVRIEGAVTGLGAGSDVLFNGVKVGKVSGVDFDPDDPRIVIAEALVLPSTPLRADTKATLGILGLTGQAYISLKGGTPNAPKLLSDNPDAPVPEIDARESAVADILETVRTVASRVDTVAGELQQFVAENRAPLSRAVTNIEVFSQSLSNNAKGVDLFLVSLADTSNSLKEFSSKLDGSIEGMEKLIKAVEPEKVKTTVDNVAAFTTELRNNGTHVGTIIQNVEKTTSKLALVSQSLEGPVVKEGLNNFAAAAGDAKQAMGNIKDATSALQGKKEEIGDIITNVSQMSQRLNQASVRVDGVLVKLESFLGSGDAGSITSELSSTLGEFKKLAQNLNAQVTNISKGLNSFSNRGLKDVQTLVNQTRASVDRFGSLVRELERNPQRVISGNKQVREYQGRPRR